MIDVIALSHGQWDSRQTTNHELLFLYETARRPADVLRWPDGRKRLPPVETLRRYLAGARYRSDWGEIDPAIVLPFVRRLITYVEANALVPEMGELLREMAR